MRESLLNIFGFLLSPIFAILALAVMLLRGKLRASHFAAIEPRRTPLQFIDLFVGFCILLIGGVFLLPRAMQLAGYTGVPDPGAEPDGLRLAVTALLAQLTTQLPVVLYIFYRVGSVPEGFRSLGITTPHRAAVVGGLLAFLAAMPMVTGTSSLMALLSRWLELETPTIAHDLLKVLLESDSVLVKSLIAFSAVVFAPILEELIFRGLVQSALLDFFRATGRWLIIFVAGVLFSLVHAGGVSWHALPGLFILGLILGWLYETHRSLWPCIIVHVLFNAANVGLGVLQLKQ